MDLKNKNLFELKQLATVLSDPLFKATKDQTELSELLVEIENRQVESIGI